MSDNVLAPKQTGLEVACPRCDAPPGVLCRDPRTGRGRSTTHVERKPKSGDDDGA